MLFIISDFPGRVDLGAGGLFAECLCPMVYPILVKPCCSRREGRDLGMGWRLGFWGQKRHLGHRDLGEAACGAYEAVGFGVHAANFSAPTSLPAPQEFCSIICVMH